VDPDIVELSNLQRQILHATPDIGRLKTESASDRIHALNPDVRVVTYPVRLTADNALEVMEEYDVIIDGTDNFATRYLSNDACFLLGKPNVFGSVQQFDGQASVFWRDHGPCYRCLFPEPPPPGAVPTCAEAGVLGIVPGVIGLLQATEAIKLVLSIGQSLAGRLLLFDALEMSTRTIRIKRNPSCPLCGDQPTIEGLVDYDQFCSAEQVEARPDDISVAELRTRLAGSPGDLPPDFLLIDLRSACEYASSHIPGAMNIPFNNLNDQLETLTSQKVAETCVYCQTGRTSAQAAAILRNAGLHPVRNLRGGFEVWNH
jgi:adenylyltransferase/sulfurtransferase